MLLCRIQRVLALQPHAIQEATDAVHVELVGRAELVVEIRRQRPLVAGDELQQGIVTVHLDQRTVIRQQRERGGGLQPNGRLLDLSVGIIRVALNIDAGNLLDMLRLAANSDRAILIGINHRAIGHTSGEYQRHMTRTRRNDRLDLGRWCRDFQ
ncbi:MAG: hypothetical protein OHK0046_38570 [Anaerolineae bacterium]